MLNGTIGDRVLLKEPFDPTDEQEIASSGAHWIVLDAKALTSGVWLIQNVLKRCPHIGISIIGSEVDVKVVGSIPELRRLAISADVVFGLESLPPVEELSLRIRGDSSYLSRLAILPRIARLSVGESGAPQDLAPLSEARELRSLIVTGSHKNTAIIAELPMLRELGLYRFRVVGRELSGGRLSSVRIRGGKVDLAAASLAALERLDLEECSFDADRLGACSLLRELSLISVRGMRVLPALSRLPVFHRLELDGLRKLNDISGIASSTLSIFRQIGDISLGVDSYIRTFETCANLRYASVLMRTNEDDAKLDEYLASRGVSRSVPQRDNGTL